MATCKDNCAFQDNLQDNNSSRLLWLYAALYIFEAFKILAMFYNVPTCMSLQVKTVVHHPATTKTYRNIVKLESNFACFKHYILLNHHEECTATVE